MCGTAVIVVTSRGRERIRFDPEVPIDEYLARFWQDLIGRVSGPMKFRLVLQPAVAAFFAVRAGLRDVRDGRTPYLWSVFAHGQRRPDLLREGWRDVGRVLVAAVAIDLVYQAAVLHAFHPVDALIVAALLAFVPYVLLRGPVNRLLRARR
jgi:hypothetical protein